MAIPRGSHPFPFRTRSLSPSGSMVLLEYIKRESRTPPGLSPEVLKGTKGDYMKASSLNRGGFFLGKFHFSGPFLITIFNVLYKFSGELKLKQSH